VKQDDTWLKEQAKRLCTWSRELVTMFCTWLTELAKWRGRKPKEQEILSGVTWWALERKLYTCRRARKPCWVFRAGVVMGHGRSTLPSAVMIVVSCLSQEPLLSSYSSMG